MIARKSCQLIYSAAIVAVVIFAIIWVYLEPHSWLRALIFAAVVSCLIVVVFNAGILEGIAHAQAMATMNQLLKEPTPAVSIDKVDALRGVMAEADLYGHELANGLVPDGNSESNPGLGPMDFSEWREWKQRQTSKPLA